MVALGNFFFRYRTTISPLLLLLLLLPGAAVLSDPFVAAVLGLIVACLGQLIRWATIGLEYIVRGGRNHRVYADGLVTEGLFRHSRNPMYVGKFLMVLGTGIASNRWPSLLAITVAYSFMYQAVTLAEEDYLRRKFGAAFDEYCRRVPRWWPTLPGLRETFARSEFKWARVLRKGYSEPLGWTLPISAIGLYNLSRLPAGAQPALFETTFLVGLVVIAALFWLTTGWLKKTSIAALRIPDA
jgi:protein-S-isoprenylcysteine O-methyltransferase Ste14